MVATLVIIATSSSTVAMSSNALALLRAHDMRPHGGGDAERSEKFPPQPMSVVGQTRTLARLFEREGAPCHPEASPDTGRVIPARSADTRAPEHLVVIWPSVAAGATGGRRFGVRQRPVKPSSKQPLHVELRNHCPRSGAARSCQKADINRSLDLTSSARASTPGRRHVEAESLRGLQVDHKFVLCGCLHWKIGRLFAPEDAVERNWPHPGSSGSAEVGSIGDEPAAIDEVAPPE